MSDQRVFVIFQFKPHPPQGRSDGGYIGIYTPKKISIRFVHMWDINT